MKKIILYNILIVLMISFIACDDNFSDIMKSENNSIESGQNVENPVKISFESSVSYTNEYNIDHEINIILLKASKYTVNVTLTVLDTGTAEHDADYSLQDWNSPENIIFTPGETKKSVKINMIQDSINEGNETINLQLSSAGNAEIIQGSHQVIIIDDESFQGLPVVSFESYISSIENEEDSEVINIILSEASDNFVEITVSDPETGSAELDTDYIYAGWTSPEIVTFNPGETIKTISISSLQDLLFEGNETVNLELSDPVNAILGLNVHQLIIADDDNPPPAVTIISFETSLSSTANEAAVPHDINIILSEISADTVTVTIADQGTGSAELGSDYTHTGWISPATITFNPGETEKTVSITPLQDTIFEGSETINLALSGPENAVLGLSAHQAIINDDDIPPVTPIVSFESSSGVTADESETSHNINIVLSEPSGNTIRITVSDLKTGTAGFGTDYTHTGWTSPHVIIFNPGETVKTVAITPVQDTIDEGTGESVNLKLTNPVNTLLGTSNHLLIIVDDDDTPGWRMLNDISTPRAGAAMALEGDWIYIYGGEDESGGALNDFWRYNLLTEIYEPLSNDFIPVDERSRAYAALVNLNGNLYLYGGTDKDGAVFDKKDMYFFDTVNYPNQWKKFDNSDTNGSWPVERSHHIAVPVYNGSTVESIYFQGGKDGTGITLPDSSLYEIDFTATPKYDWIIDNISYIRSEHAAAYYNNNIWFFGGFDGVTYYNDLNTFNVNTHVFLQVALIGPTILPERSGISMIEHNGRLYVFGGTDGVDSLNDLWYFQSGSWNKVSDAPFERAFYSAVKYNGKLIVFGGYYINASSQKIYSSELWQCLL